MSLQPRFVDSVPSRRDFLKTSMAAAAGAATLGGLSLARSAHAAGSDVLAHRPDRLWRPWSRRGRQRHER